MAATVEGYVIAHSADPRKRLNRTARRRPAGGEDADHHRMFIPSKGSPTSGEHPEFIDEGWRPGLPSASRLDAVLKPAITPIILDNNLKKKYSAI